MREALEEMAGEQDGTSAQMLQLIRENLEEALTGESAEELREALRKAGVEDALGVRRDRRHRLALRRRRRRRRVDDVAHRLRLAPQRRVDHAIQRIGKHRVEDVARLL